MHLTAFSIICYNYLLLAFFSSILLIRPSTTTAFSSNSSKRLFIGTPANKSRRLISDCMTPIHDLVTLTEYSTVNEAVHLLLKLGVSGAPVVRNSTGELVGVVSSFDFLQQEAGEGTLLPPIEGGSDNKDTVESYLSAARKICAKRVGDLMTTNLRTMECTESMRNAAALMTQEKLHRLPIVDEDGKLVGMLTSSDVMIDMVHVIKNLPPAAEDYLEDDNNHGLNP